MIGSTPIRASARRRPPAVLLSRFHENAMERTTNDDAAKNAFNMGKVYTDPPPETPADARTTTRRTDMCSSSVVVEPGTVGDRNRRLKSFKQMARFGQFHYLSFDLHHPFESSNNL